MPQLLAFPSAEGFGRFSKGAGLGPSDELQTPVIERVTNHNSSGAGSFREACLKTYPKFVHFDLGGTFPLGSNLVMQSPYTTISGQTAPGGGVQIKNWGVSSQSHDLICRHLRVRQGPDGVGANWQNTGGIYYGVISNATGPNNENYEIHDHIWDHCSIGWVIGKSLEAYGAGVRKITFQWCMAYEPMRTNIHPFGSFACLLGQPFHAVGEITNEITMHHNIFVHCGDRNPALLPDIMRQGLASTMFPAWRVDFRNNIVYNWYAQAFAQFRARCVNETAYNNLMALNGNNTIPSVELNFVGNKFKRGPNSFNLVEVMWLYLDGLVKIYAANNIGPISVNPVDGGNIGTRLLTSRFTGDSQTIQAHGTWDNSNNFTATEWNHAPVNTNNVLDLEDILLPQVGALVPERDAVDNRIIYEYLNNVGFSQHQNHLDYTSPAAGTPPTDSNNDGLPDYWVDKYSLQGQGPFDEAPNGYYHYVNYINELAGDQITGYGSGISAWFLSKRRASKLIHLQ